MRWLPALLLACVIAACGSPVSSAGSSATTPPTSSATPSPRSTVNRDQDAIPGPGGMTLRQEIGAVLMVGFQGPLTPAVLSDWRQRQFGGLILLPVNHNAGDPAAIRQLVQSVRGVMSHPLLVATNQEGGTVCFPQTGVPCMAGARQVAPLGSAAVQSEMATMSQGLKALGFDINLAPVADVWDGTHSSMSERSYGQDPQTVALDVTAAIAGTHAAGMYAAAKHFPGQGTTDDLVPFKAAIAAHVDFVLVGHLNVPSIDPSAPTSMSARVMQVLHSELGYQGVVISDDLQIGVLSPQYPPPAAAVRFLSNGGDMAIVSHDLSVADAADDAVYAAVLDGSYRRSQLDASVQKLLNLGLRFMP